MMDLNVGAGLCLTLVSIVAALPSTAQQLNFNSEQTTLSEQAAAFVCNTVKEAKGKISDVQIGGQVDAHLPGLVGKVLNAGGSAGGSLSRGEYEGLSRDATATALEGDRGCRERVFLAMFQKITAVAPPAPVAAPPAPVAAPPAPVAAPPAPVAAPPPPVAARPARKGLTCVVHDPKPPTNVRASPNGAIEDHLNNGDHVYINPIRFATATNNGTWAYVSNTEDQGIGWVFFPLLRCQ